MKKILKILLSIIIGLSIIFFAIEISYTTKRNSIRKFCLCDKKAITNPIKYQGIEISGNYSRGFLVGRTLKLFNDGCFQYSIWGDIQITKGKTGRYKIVENELQFFVNCYFEAMLFQEIHSLEILNEDDDRKQLGNMSICINNGEIYLGCKNPIKNKDDKEYFADNEDYFLLKHE